MAGNKTSTGKVQGPPLPVTYGAVPSGREDMAQLILSSAMRVGYTYNQALGFLANAMYESSLNPNAVGDSGVSIGLFQMNTAKGLGKGHSIENLKNPQYNLDLMLQTALKVMPPGKTPDDPRVAAELITRRIEKPKATDVEAAKRASLAAQFATNPGLKTLPAAPYTPTTMAAPGSVGSVGPIAGVGPVAGVEMPADVPQLNIDDIIAQARGLAVAPELPSIDPYLARAKDARNQALQQQLAALDTSYRKAQDAMTATRDEFTGRITDLQDQGQRYAASSAGLFNNGANGALANYNADLAANQAGSASQGFSSVKTNGPELLGAQTATDRQYMAQVYADLQNQLSNDIAAGGQLVVGSGRNAIDVARQQAGSKAQQSAADAIAELTANMLNQQYANEAEVAAQGPSRLMNAIQAIGGLAGTNADIAGKNIANRMQAQSTNADIRGRNADRTLTTQSTNADIIGKNLDRQVNLADLAARVAQNNESNRISGAQLELQRQESIDRRNTNAATLALDTKRYELEVVKAQQEKGLTYSNQLTRDKRAGEIAQNTSTILGAVRTPANVNDTKADPAGLVSTLALYSGPWMDTNDPARLSPDQARQKLRDQVRRYYEKIYGDDPKRRASRETAIRQQSAALIEEYEKLRGAGLTTEELDIYTAQVENEVGAAAKAATK